MSHAQSRQEVRYAELDALRGLAAMVVVIGHFQHLFSVKVSPLSYLLFRTPINILFAGHEAVILFFLLSGYVLSLPFLRAPQSYPVFVVRRVFRIYLPYLAALGLAIAGAYFFHGTIPALGQWFNLTWSQTPSVHGIVQHIAFLGVYDAASSIPRSGRSFTRVASR
jgi:peptidoglycan/LPS O-acetylase OafA/YrhL